MKQQTPIQKMIDWSIKNAFNVTAEDGTTYIAIDTEEMRLKFDLWLLKEKEHIIAAANFLPHDEQNEIKTPEEYYDNKYQIT